MTSVATLRADSLPWVWKAVQGRGRARAQALNPEGKKDKLITRATHLPPNRTHWSRRSMSRQLGCLACERAAHLAANDIRPHLTRIFKLSRDPNFEAKFRRVIGQEWISGCCSGLRR